MPISAAVDSRVRARASLVCRQATLRLALPLAHILETLRPLPVETLPGMPLFVRGVSVVRGAPVPVVEAAALLGVVDGPPATRWVMLRAGDHRMALAVGAVVGVLDLAPHRSAPLPPLLRPGSVDVVAEIGVLDADLLVVLRSAGLLSDADWRALAGRRLEA